MTETLDTRLDERNTVADALDITLDAATPAAEGPGSRI